MENKKYKTRNGVFYKRESGIMNGKLWKISDREDDMGNVSFFNEHYDLNEAIDKFKKDLMNGTKAHMNIKLPDQPIVYGTKAEWEVNGVSWYGNSNNTVVSNSTVEKSKGVWEQMNEKPTVNPWDKEAIEKALNNLFTQKQYYGETELSSNSKAVDSGSDNGGRDNVNEGLLGEKKRGEL